MFYITFSLIVTYLCCYFFILHLIRIISIPYIFFTKNDFFNFIFVDIFEILNTYIVFCCYVTFFLGMPVICYFFFSFIKSGLFLYEKIYLSHLFKIVVKLLILSSLFCYFLLMPFILFYLCELSNISNVDFLLLEVNVKLYEFIIFTCKLFFVYCFIIFQLPTFMIMLFFFREPSKISFLRFRKFYLIISCILGCLLSASDFLSFFFTSILFFSFFEIFTFLSILKDRYLCVLDKQINIVLF